MKSDKAEAVGEAVDYGAWILQGPKEKRQTTDEEPSLRLFCIPQAGMGARAFHGWQEAVGEQIEVMPVELPGRNSRQREPRYTCMKDLVRDLVDALLPEFRRNPFCLLGHSLGAWIAYEVVHELWRRHEPLPLKLYVSANRAPHLCHRSHDVHPVHLHQLNYEQFWEAFEVRYGSNKDLRSEGIRKYVYPMLKDDFTLLETYEWRGFTTTANAVSGGAGSRGLPVPIEAFGAKGDTRYTKEQISGWREHTTVDFREKWFEGPHRYIVDQPEEVRKHVAYDLFGCLV